ncbi:unnamed protein product [Strongylus vulgaris]|uniref:Uncharacterized protein n=1 Tax=Strongylus vulgaris TaxID=40348 RepID=A0A3P7KY63_STRVU|nr:unnamed protein product [Strongylus vulgaris]
MKIFTDRCDVAWLRLMADPHIRGDDLVVKHAVATRISEHVTSANINDFIVRHKMLEIHAQIKMVGNGKRHKLDSTTPTLLGPQFDSSCIALERMIEVDWVYIWAKQARPLERETQRAARRAHSDWERKQKAKKKIESKHNQERKQNICEVETASVSAAPYVARLAAEAEHNDVGSVSDGECRQDYRVLSGLSLIGHYTVANYLPLCDARTAVGRSAIGLSG